MATSTLTAAANRPTPKDADHDDANEGKTVTKDPTDTDPPTAPRTPQKTPVARS